VPNSIINLNFSDKNKQKSFYLRFGRFRPMSRKCTSLRSRPCTTRVSRFRNERREIFSNALTFHFLLSYMFGLSVTSLVRSSGCSAIRDSQRAVPASWFSLLTSPRGKMNVVTWLFSSRRRNSDCISNPSSFSTLAASSNVCFFIALAGKIAKLEIKMRRNIKLIATYKVRKSLADVFLCRRRISCSEEYKSESSPSNCRWERRSWSCPSSPAGHSTRHPFLQQNLATKIIPVYFLIEEFCQKRVNFHKNTQYSKIVHFATDQHNCHCKWERVNVDYHSHKRTSEIWLIGFYFQPK